jgi:hypothetical protein
MTGRLIQNASGSDPDSINLKRTKKNEKGKENRAKRSKAHQ